MFFEIPKRTTFGSSTSAFWQDFLTEEEISTVLSFPEWEEVQEGKVGYQSETEGVVNENIRRSKVSWITPSESNLFLWQKVTDVVSEVNRRHFHFDLSGCYEPMQLSVYHDTDLGCYEWHTDCSEKSSMYPRKLSMSLILSDPDEYEGGELQLKPDSDYPVTLECKKGRAIFFPSYTLHRVAPVTKGTRKSIVLWVGGPPFK